MTVRPIHSRDWKLTFPKKGEDWQHKEQFDDFSQRSLSEHLTTVRSRGQLRPGEIAVISVIRNEAARLPLYFAHYKKLGVTRFLIVDNNSDDGSSNLLFSEPLADIFQTTVPFSESCFGNYWHNGIAHAYCRGNWVLMADADELLVYDGMGHHDLKALAQWLDRHKFDRILCIMVDVYPAGFIGRGAREIAEILDKDCWFDNDGYFASRTLTGWAINGGARHRLFEVGRGKVPAPISKYPFFRMGSQVSICNPHYFWPFDTTTNVILGTFVHLKLMDDFIQRSAASAAEGQHWMNALHYRAINQTLVGMPDLVAINSSSQRYTGPDDFVMHRIISPIKWEGAGGSDAMGVRNASFSHLVIGKIGWRPWRETMPDYGGKWARREEFNALSLRSLREHLSVVRCRGPLRNGELGLVCVLRNELARLPLFFDHYKMLGVTRFFIVDNGSDDGSQELLLKEQSVDIFYTEVPFKEGQAGLYWANGIIRTYCMGHWVVRPDADELLVYDGMENHDLRQLAEWLEDRNLDRLYAPLLDVYPSGAVVADNHDISDFLRFDCWFDSAGYDLTWTRGGWNLTGGPRKRLFRQANDDGPLLSKYPFFRVSEETTIFNHHWLWPYDEVTRGPQGTLLHLKLTNDLAERAKRYVGEGQHFNNSQEYKVINDRLATHPNLVAFNGSSCRYRGPKSLVRQRFMLPIDWRKATVSEKIGGADFVKSQSVPDRRRWTNSLPNEGNFWEKQNEFNWVSHSSLTEHLSIIRCRGPLVRNEIGLVCVLRNEANRLPYFFEHYKKLGVTRFFMIDNESDDGSHEVSLNESMADIFVAHASYAEGLGGIYWANGIAREFCRGCWVIRVDADELFVYDGMERNNLPQLARWLEAEGRDRIFALMIDVYPSGAVDHGTRSIPEMIEADCWFDSDGYEEEKHKGGWLISGGPRRRLFSQGPVIHRHWLSKYPFVLIKPEISIVDAHFVWPVEERKPAVMSALLHLKFADDFRDRSMRYEQEGQHALGSRAYQIINEHLAQMPDFVVHYSGSKRYEGPHSLIRHGLVQSIDWSK